MSLILTAVCCCEEQSDEAISMELHGVRDCFARNDFLYFASLFRKHATICERYEA